MITLANMALLLLETGKPVSHKGFKCEVLLKVKHLVLSSVPMCLWTDRLRDLYSRKVQTKRKFFSVDWNPPLPFPLQSRLKMIYEIIDLKNHTMKSMAWMITKPHFTFSSTIFNFNGWRMKDLKQMLESMLIDRAILTKCFLLDLPKCLRFSF